MFSFVTSNLKNSNDTKTECCFEQQNQKKIDDENEKFENLKKQVLTDRKMIQKKQKKNPLYFNVEFKEPWKVSYIFVNFSKKNI